MQLKIRMVINWTMFVANVDVDKPWCSPHPPSASCNVPLWKEDADAYFMQDTQFCRSGGVRSYIIEVLTDWHKYYIWWISHITLFTNLESHLHVQLAPVTLWNQLEIVICDSQAIVAQSKPLVSHCMPGIDTLVSFLIWEKMMHLVEWAIALLHV